MYCSYLFLKLRFSCVSRTLIKTFQVACFRSKQSFVCALKNIFIFILQGQLKLNICLHSNTYLKKLKVSNNSMYIYKVILAHFGFVTYLRSTFPHLKFIPITSTLRAKHPFPNIFYYLKKSNYMP